ncbi:MAG: bis(5'-nucleosyl)-tetraphosphatase (symmetrical) YqeK [Lachnospiraceae bacterium]
MMKSLHPKTLEKKMDEDRFEHTIGVAYTSVCLAMRYGRSSQGKCWLLLDCAKCIPDDIKLDKCKRNNIPITKAQEQSPSLHAKLGAFIALTIIGLKIRIFLNAIEYHTTGRPAMSLLEKIVFVADYIEPRRNKASNLSKLRQMAFIDIDRTVYEIMDQTLRYLKAKKVPIDSLTKKSCDYYRALCGEKDVENETERN